MAIELSALLMQMSKRGLGFRRTAEGIEVTGDCTRLTPELRQAIQDNRAALTGMLPAESPAASQANAIRAMLDEFARWLLQFAGWAGAAYRQQIDKRLTEAVDTQNPSVVARVVETLKQEVEGVNWAAEILPSTFEAEAKHAIAAGAGPAGGEAPDEIPF